MYKEKSHLRSACKLLAICFLAAIVVGCARTKPVIPLTQLEIEKNQLNEKIDTSIYDSSRCTKKLNDSPIGQKVADQILILSATQINRDSLLKSKAKLTDQQKNTLNDYLDQNVICRNILLWGLKGTPMLAEQEKSNFVDNQIYDALISRKTAIGDANFLLFNLNQASNRAFSTVLKSWNNDLQAKIASSSPAQPPNDYQSNNVPANAALLVIACSFSKNPKACSAGALSGSANEPDRSSRGKDYSDEIFDNIKKQQLIDETKRQMQMDLDYEKRRKEMLDFKTKSRQ